MDLNDPPAILNPVDRTLMMVYGYLIGANPLAAERLHRLCREYLHLNTGNMIGVIGIVSVEFPDLADGIRRVAMHV